MKYILLCFSLLIVSCEDNSQGCCRYPLQNGGAWGCTDDSYIYSCEQTDGSDFFKDTDCSTVSYCTQSNCQAMGCNWVDGNYTDWCECN